MENLTFHASQTPLALTTSWLCHMGWGFSVAASWRNSFLDLRTLCLLKSQALRDLHLHPSSPLSQLPPITLQVGGGVGTDTCRVQSSSAACFCIPSCYVILYGQ